MRRPVATGVYLVAAVLFGAGAFLLYPLIGFSELAGFVVPSPTILVLQDKPLGAYSAGVVIEVGSVDGPAELKVSQIDVSSKSSPGASLTIALETWVGSGFKFDYQALACTVETTEPTREIRAITTSAEAALVPLFNLAVKENKMTGVPKVSGGVTQVSLPESVKTIKVSCPMPNYRFTSESLANRGLYLPGVQTYGTSGVDAPSSSYSVARGGSDFIVQASQLPSETLAESYTWYERNYEYLARQGLFLTVSSPSRQNESAYRLFAAGALLGLAGAFLVAAAQNALGVSN